MRGFSKPESMEAGTAIPVPMSQVGTVDDFNALWREYRHEVWAVAYALLNDPDAAEDVVSEAYLRLWRWWEKGVVVANPMAWLMQVCLNRAKDCARSAFRRHGTQGVDAMEVIRSKEPQPQEGAIVSEILAIIRQEMPAADRKLILRKAKGYSTKELTGKFGPGIKRRLERARSRLRDRLGIRCTRKFCRQR